MHNGAKISRVLPMVALACALGSCMESTVGAPSAGPDPAAVRETLALELRNPLEAREFIHGDVVLFTVPGKGVALAVDGGASRGAQDGYVDQVFVLQQAQPTTMDSRFVPNAELQYAGRAIVLRAADRAPLLFVMRGDGDPEPELDGVPESGAERFVGHGISRGTGAWQVRLEEVTGASMAALLPLCASAPVEGDVRLAATCDSGGPGSTSCSTTCLTVNGGSCSPSPQRPPINITWQPQR